MKKKVLLAFCMILILSSCSNDKTNEKKILENDVKVEQKKQSNESLEKELPKEKAKDKSNEDKEVKNKIKSEIKRNGQYQDIYDRLKGLKFKLSGGSMVEALYFYRDGYFDGVEKGGNGGHISIALYNGKFDVKEKLSDTSYLLSLKRLDSDINVGEDKTINIDGFDNIFHYTDSLVIPKENIGKDYIIHLPETKYGELNERDIDFINMMTQKPHDTQYDSQEEVGFFLLSEKVDSGHEIKFIEYKK